MKLLKEELRKERERIKSMNQQPIQVPSDNLSQGDEITQYTEAAIACFERCKNSVGLLKRF